MASHAMAATLPIPLQIRKPARAARHRRHSPAAPLRFVSSPALLPACAFALGIVIAHLRWLLPVWLLLALPLLGGLALLAAWRAPRLSLPALCMLFLVLGCFASEVQPPVDPQESVVQLASAGQAAVMTGTVVRVEPQKQTTYTAFFGHKAENEVSRRVDLQLSSYQIDHGGIIGLKGGARVTLYTKSGAKGGALLPALGCGTRVQVEVALHPESHYDDPGVWDAAQYMLGQGIGAYGSADAAKARVLGAGRPSIGCRLHQLQTTASTRVMSLSQLPAFRRLPAFLQITPTDASMLTAMLTGDRSYLQRPTRTGFERTGSFHLLVVSGLHLAIFSSLILVLARRLRLSKLAATLATIALSFAYAVFTGFGEPVQRSLCMVTLYLLGRLIFRERHALQTLGVAALLLMAASPRALGASSLQMTLLTVIAIAGFAVPFAEQTFAPYLGGLRNLWLVPIDASIPPKVAQLRVTLRMLASHLRPLVGRTAARRWMPRGLAWALGAFELALVSAIVELVMALPMAIYFHRITVLGLPVNVLIIPLLGLLLPAAMLCFATLLIAPAAAIVPAVVTAALLHAVSAVVDGFAHLSAGNYRLPAPPGLRVLGWVVLIALGIYCVRRKERWAAPVAAALLMGATFLAVAPQDLRHRRDALEISAIDVGQGDSILVVTPDGKTMLVDAGGLVGEPPGSNFDMGEEVVSPALWARGIRRLDVVAITHAHMDHIGGIPAVLANFHPLVLIVGNNPLSANYRAILVQAAQEHIPVVQHFEGDHWRLGADTSVQALWPSHAYRPKAQPGNNDSLVLRLVYKNTSALLEGDAQALAENAMLRAGELGHTDFLKVGHHGSLSSTTPAFLAAVSPEYGAISCGLRNFYGHPRQGTLDKLQGAGVRTFRTDTLGEADFYLDGRKVSGQPWAEGALFSNGVF
jgi:competence protein ComEC